jgi:putative ABC transport system substrate-binding protein
MHIMKRIILTFLIILISCSAHAGEFKVAVIKSGGLLPYDEAIEGFRAELQGQNVSLIPVNDIDNRSQLAARISAIRPDVILCLGTKALESVSDIRNIPKIFCLVSLSKAYSLTNKQNVYGVVIDISPAMQFKIIKNAFPKVKRIGIIYNPKHNQKLIGEAEKSAHAMGFRLIATQVHSIKEIPSALHKLENNVDLLWSIYDQTVYGPETAKYILLFALRKNIPFVGFSPQFAKAGALMALYGNYRDMGRQAALIAKKVLNNKEPEYKYIEPRETGIAINEKVAKVLKISFPDNFIRTTDKIY